MVVLVEEGAEAHVEVVERAEGACEVEAALAEGAPEALHFPSRRRVVGLGVQEGRPHAGASEGERVAAVGGPVVEVNSVGGAMFAHGTHEQAEHVDLSLLVHGLERDDVPRGVVEHAVNAHGLFLAADQELSPMADVAVPERAGMRSLPSETLLAVDAISQRALIETAGGKEAAQRGGGEDVGVQASIGDERIEDPLGRGARPLAANVAEEILLLGGEGPRGPPIGAWLGPQGGKSPLPVQAVPALERRHGEGARRGRPRRPEALLTEGLEFFGKCASRRGKSSRGTTTMHAPQPWHS